MPLGISPSTPANLAVRSYHVKIPIHCYNFYRRVSEERNVQSFTIQRLLQSMIVKLKRNTIYSVILYFKETQLISYSAWIDSK